MASMRLACTMLALMFLVYAMTLLTVSLAESSSAESKPDEAPKKRPKFNITRYKEFIMTDNIEWNRTRKEDDKRPSYAVLHAYVTCGSNYTGARDFIGSLMSQEYWPNVLWKNGQDARPTLYIFTKDKKYAHRHDVVDHTADQIKDLLRTYGFNGTPDPEEAEEEPQDEADNKKTEL